MSEQRAGAIDGGDADLHALLQQVELSPFKPTQSRGRREFRRGLSAAAPAEEEDEEVDDSDEAEKENVDVNVPSVASSASSEAQSKGRRSQRQRAAEGGDCGDRL